MPVDSQWGLLKRLVDWLTPTRSAGDGLIEAADTPGEEVPTKPGLINALVYGTFSGSVVLQVSYDGGDTWVDIHVFWAADSVTVEDAEAASYKMRTGSDFSGAVNWHIGQGS